MKKILVTLVFSMLLFPPYAVFAEGDFAVQIGSFGSEENAQSLVDELDSKGFLCETKRTSSLFKVQCGKFDNKEQANSLLDDIKAGGYKDSIVTSFLPVEPVTEEVAPAVAPTGVATTGAAMTGVATTGAAMTGEMLSGDDSEEAAEEADVAEEVPTEEAPIEADMEDNGTLMDEEQEDAGEIPEAPETPEIPSVAVALPPDVALAKKVESLEETARGPEMGTISGDVLETGGRYLHPFIAVTGLFTDNVFKSKDDRESDYAYIISPGLWASFPATGSQPSLTDLSVSSAGGLLYSNPSANARTHLSGYAYFRGDAEEYSYNDSEDTVNHTGEAKVAYNSLSGFYFALSDQYLRSHEDRAADPERERYLYTANRASADLILGEGKTADVAIGYSIYDLEYDNNYNLFRERNDREYRGYLSFKLMPKTKIFLGYKYLVIDYDEDVVIDSIEKHYTAGIQWIVSNKTTGILRGAQSVKQFDEDYDIDDETTTTGELQVTYIPSPKVRLSVKGARSWRETDLQANVTHILTQTGRLGLGLRLSRKLSADFSATYTKDEYNGEVTFNTQTDERLDETYIGFAGLKFDISRLIALSVGYVYKKRDSNFDLLDYYANTWFFRISAGL